VAHPVTRPSDAQKKAFLPALAAGEMVASFALTESEAGSSPAGTGKQKTLRDYFDRPAINGRDDRGGAMGLLFATERMAAE